LKFNEPNRCANKKKKKRLMMPNMIMENVPGFGLLPATIMNRILPFLHGMMILVFYTNFAGVK